MKAFDLDLLEIPVEEFADKGETIIALDPRQRLGIIARFRKKG